MFSKKTLWHSLQHTLLVYCEIFQGILLKTNINVLKKATLIVNNVYCIKSQSLHIVTGNLQCLLKLSPYV